MTTSGLTRHHAVPDELFAALGRLKMTPLMTSGSGAHLNRVWIFAGSLPAPVRLKDLRADQFP